MSLHIYIAHSGEHLLADPVAFASYVLSLDYRCGDVFSHLSSLYMNAR